MRIFIILFFFCAISIFVGTSDKSSAEDSLNSSATAELQIAVGRMNAWLNGSSNSQGWRKYLLLNLLDSQAAKGDQADLWMLQKVLSRFSGNVDGLDSAEFNDVRIALERQVAMLSRSRNVDLPFAIDSAFYQYHTISIAELESARDRAVYELELLKRYYRKTLPSRDRADIFYDLQLDQQVEYLNDLEFELPPEASVGKVESMILDEMATLKEVEAEIDAMPIEEDYGEDEEDEAEAGPEPDDFDEPFITPPSPDDGEPTLEELELQTDRIRDRIKELKELRLDLKEKDADRVADRKAVLIKLAEFNSGYLKVAEDQRDPWFVSTALTAERFNFLYFYATDDNLQEEFLRRLTDMKELIEESPNLSDRGVHGEAGKLIEWFESAAQAPQLVSAVRAMHSHPNMYVSVSSRLLNQQLDTDVSRRQRVKEVIFGKIVRGVANVSGNLQVVLRPDPDQVNVAIELLGAITSQTYSRERNWRINASSCANYHARRELFANIGGLHATDVQSDAIASATYGGISAQLGLVQKIAAEKFAKLKPKNDAESSRRIKAQISEPFIEQTDKAVTNAKAGLVVLNEKIEEFSSFIPQLFARTHSDRIEVVAHKSNQGSLASPGLPNGLVSSDVTLALHETMLSNYIDPVLAGKTFKNTEMRQELETALGIELPDPEDDYSEADSEAGVEDDEPFSITFARVRPVQLEFANNQLAVTVTGRRFAQGGRAIRAGLSFRLNFRIVEENGVMRLDQVGDIETKLTDPDKKSAKLIAFRDLLKKRLNEGVDKIDGIKLPPNLIPEQVADTFPLAGKLSLVDLRFEGGWIYAGWNSALGYDVSPASLAAVSNIQMNQSQPLPGTPFEIGPIPGGNESEQAPPMPDLNSPGESVLDGKIGQAIEGGFVNEVIIDGGSGGSFPVATPIR